MDERDERMILRELLRLREAPRLCGEAAYCNAKRGGDPQWRGPLCPHCDASENAFRAWERLSRDAMQKQNG